MFPVSCLGIWWCHAIWIPEKIKFDYLKNEKSFSSEIKNIFPWFEHFIPSGCSALHGVDPNFKKDTSGWVVFLYLFVPSITRYTCSFFKWLSQFFFLSYQMVYFLLNISLQFFVWCEFMNLVIEISLIGQPAKFF